MPVVARRPGGSLTCILTNTIQDSWSALRTAAAVLLTYTAVVQTVAMRVRGKLLTPDLDGMTSSKAGRKLHATVGTNVVGVAACAHCLHRPRPGACQSRHREWAGGEAEGPHRPEDMLRTVSQQLCLIRMGSGSRQACTFSCL